MYGTLMVTIVLLTVLLKIASEFKYWTWLTHFAVWGSIAFFFAVELVCVCDVRCVCLGGCNLAVSWTWWAFALGVDWAGIGVRDGHGYYAHAMHCARVLPPLPISLPHAQVYGLQSTFAPEQHRLFYWVGARPAYWLAVALGVAASLLPDITYNAARRAWAPADWQILQEMFRGKNRAALNAHASGDGFGSGTGSGAGDDYGSTAAPAKPDFESVVEDREVEMTGRGMVSA